MVKRLHLHGTDEFGYETPAFRVVDDYGDYVEYEDYKKLKAKNRRYKDALKPLEGRSPLAAMKYIDHLEQKIKRLREAARAVCDVYFDRDAEGMLEEAQRLAALLEEM